MPLLSFFVRRFVTGAIARKAARFLERRFKLSPALASIAFMVITEVLARATEKKFNPNPETTPKTAPRRGKWFGKRS